MSVLALWVHRSVRAQAKTMNHLLVQACGSLPCWHGSLQSVGGGEGSLSTSEWQHGISMLCLSIPFFFFFFKAAHKVLAFRIRNIFKQPHHFKYVEWSRNRKMLIEKLVKSHKKSRFWFLVMYQRQFLSCVMKWQTVHQGRNWVKGTRKLCVLTLQLFCKSRTIQKGKVQRPPEPKKQGK